MTDRLIESLGTTEPLAAAFSDAAIVRAMLDVEAALARAEARVGVIPAAAADAIAGAAAAGDVDAHAIARAARSSGTFAIPLVDALRDRVRARDERATTYVHWGATSQDIVDTALMLCVRRSLPSIAGDHERLARELRRKSDVHAATIMLARTLLQPALPTTFGLKAAGWFASIARSWTRVTAAADEALVLQFGGAAGTLAAFGTKGPAVGAELARELGVNSPGAPWHTQRDRLAAFVAACGIYVGALGKMARDVSLLMQAEIGEASERGGSSSSMPHKKNPAGCAIVLAAANRLPGLVSTFLAALVQEHERGLGGWHAEAPTIAAAVETTGAAAAAAASTIESLTVDVARMRANVAATHGVVFAERAMVLLAPALGREAALRAIEAAVETARRERRSFASILAADAAVRSAVAADVLASLEAPDAYLGAAEEFRRRLLDS